MLAAVLDGIKDFDAPQDGNSTKEGVGKNAGVRSASNVRALYLDSEFGVTFQSAAAAVAGAISGTGLFAYGLYLRTKLSSCLRWPQTEGTVSQSCLETDDGIRISIFYEYTVNGVAYSSSRIQFGTPTTYIRQSSAEAAISHYPVGSHCIVYYDPENPAQAILDRSSSGSLQYIIGGIILLVMTVLVILYPGRTNNWDVGLILPRAQGQPAVSPRMR